MKGEQGKQKKIMLALMPFWAPLTPPLGISCIKSYLRKFRYDIKIVDLNILPGLWEFHSSYISVLKKYIPEDKQGNLFMVGYDVMMNHITAHINYEDYSKFLELIRILIKENFFCDAKDELVNELVNIVSDFYAKLKDEFEKVLLREKPDILGLSVYNSTLGPSLFAFRLAKELLPDIETVMGGGIFADQLNTESPDFEFFLKKTPYIDKIMIGEGELLFLHYLRGELDETKSVYTREDIDNRMLDLSEVSIPEFSDLNTELYPYLATYGSRSCIHQCSFCSETVQWGKYRKKNEKQLVDELMQMSEMYNCRLFLLGDSLINPIIDDFTRELIERGKNIYWDGYLRADKHVCDTKNTLFWRKGGFYRARLGIESGSQHVLDLMNKKTNIKQIKEAIMSLAYAGIKTTTYWVLGHPGETEEDFNDTLSLLVQLKDYIYEADFHPFFYYPTGQVKSVSWSNENGINLLYPEEMTDMLITQTWLLNTYPAREEIYKRVCRFAECCKKNGIPNPYSLKDIYDADRRWKSLHKNSVPELVELKSKVVTDESSRVNKLSYIKNVKVEDGNFDF